MQESLQRAASASGSYMCLLGRAKVFCCPHAKIRLVQSSNMKMQFKDFQSNPFYQINKIRLLSRSYRTIGGRKSPGTKSRTCWMCNLSNVSLISDA